ncbi:hypothetical protein N2W52_002071 [Clostridium perfringens]|nr:hypothetical protein [Clostridium perfringens]
MMNLIYEEPNYKEYECLDYEIVEKDYRSCGIKVQVSSRIEYRPVIYTIYNDNKIIDFEIEVMGRGSLTSKCIEQMLKEYNVALEMVKILKDKYIN